MVKLNEIEKYLDSFLNIKKYNKQDRKNGLIVRGRQEVKKAGSAVNTTLDNIRLAKKNNIDLLLVHHGGWRKEDLDLYKERIDLLKKSKISLYVAHASLDCKKEISTGESLAKALGINREGYFCRFCGGFAGVYGTIKPVSFELFKKKMQKRFKPNFLKCSNNKIKKIGIVTGGGAKSQWIKEAADLGCDTYITGESSSSAKIYAKERKINLFSSGHTATEADGITALGEAVKKKFKIKVIKLKEAMF